MADQLKQESLEWAITHIKRFGDTDIFPVPFEYDAIRHGRDSVFEHLSAIDLSKYEPRPLSRFLVPKPRGGYRVAIQLDPLDTLVYTAIVYEAAELIEQNRIPPERRMACSFRIEIDARGQFFRARNGWPDFHEHSAELANSGSYEYVLLADIADFYNQSSLHRVKNALEIAGVSPERAENTENFLLNLTARQSRGIPVGPSASIILSEACLNDVDMFLLRKGYVHTRYSDDFRVFCIDRSQAYRALHDLSEYLYTSHRLTLQSSKTGPMPIKEFVEKELLDPERLEERGKAEKLSQVLSILQEHIAMRYGSPEVEESMEEILATLPEQQLRIVRENIVELFDTCLAQSPLHLGLARYLLRRATSLQTGVLLRRTLSNLDTLAPVMRDAAKYIIRSVRVKTATEVSNTLTNFLDSSDLAFMPYLRLWITEVFLTKLASGVGDSVYGLFESTRDQLGVRPMARLARELGFLDWVRERKEVWSNHGPWDRRAIIWAASVLPADEKRFWLQRVQNSGDPLERVVAGAVMGQ